MAMKKCPACGKKVSSGAYYCIYCSHIFEQPRSSDASAQADRSRSAVPVKAGEKQPAQDQTRVIFTADGDIPSRFGRTPGLTEMPPAKTEPADEEMREITREDSGSTEDTVDIFTRREPKTAAPLTKPSAPKWRKRLIAVGIVAVVLAAILIAVLLSDGAGSGDSPSAPSNASTVPTRDAQKDAWLSTFTGEWVDEQSTGKGNIPLQGGGQLTIYSTDNDRMVFDLLSYSGGEQPTVASLIGMEGQIEDKKVTFRFDDDGLGNRGEGYMLLSDEGIAVEITLADTVTGKDGIPQISTHSIAMNARFARISLPSSDGLDIRQLDTLEKVQAAAGEQTADPVANKDGTTSYTYGMLQVTAAADGAVKNIQVDYSASEEKSRYCYDCVDGTMNYEVIKTYFGEAEYDYTEQPTNIRVLYYLVGGTQTVTFTFDAQDNLLMDILFVY